MSGRRAEEGIRVLTHHQPDPEIVKGEVCARATDEALALVFVVGFVACTVSWGLATDPSSASSP